MFKVETQIMGMKIKWKRSQSIEQKYWEIEIIREMGRQVQKTLHES